MLRLLLSLGFIIESCVADLGVTLAHRRRTLMLRGPAQSVSVARQHELPEPVAMLPLLGVVVVLFGLVAVLCTGFVKLVRKRRHFPAPVKALSTPAKMFSATVKPCPPPAPPKRPKKLALGKDEVHMKGAPEGTVYEVKVYRSEELQPSPDPEAELLSIVAAKSDDWAVQHSAVDSARRLTIYHTALVLPHLPQVVELVATTVSNLRSSVARNALLAIEDMYTHIAEQLQMHSERLVGIVLGRCSGEKKFLVTCAQTALMAALTHGPVRPTLCGVLPYVSSRNVDVAALALGGVDVLIKRLSCVPSFFRENERALSSLIRALASGVNCRNPSGRNTTRAVLSTLRERLTPKVFDTQVNLMASSGALPCNTAADLIREASRMPMQPVKPTNKPKRTLSKRSNTPKAS